MEETARGGIKRPLSIRERVYLRIKDEILAGDLPPGSEVVETHMAEKLDVSRTPVHQAVVRLEQEGFVVIDPREGIYVAPISESEVKEICQVRVLLEAGLVREIGGKFTAEELDEMGSFLDSAGEALERLDVAAFLDANRDFHRQFDRKYGNERVSAILTNLDAHVRRILTISWSQEKVRLSHRQHRLILQSLRQGDANSAADLLVEHIWSAVA